MYFNQGINPNEIGDFEVVEENGKIHLFYLALPSHDRIGHLVSANGIEWEEYPTAITTGNPGDFDGDQIWTPGIFKNGSRWFMLYTGNERCGRIQRIGLAVSDDLILWKKHDGNPVIAPDPRYYEAEQTGRFRVDFRDPHVIFAEGRFHMYCCARSNEGPLNRRGCVAHAVSRDGIAWTLTEPACEPRFAFDLECPSAVRLGERYYIFAILPDRGRSIALVADSPDGPFRRFPGNTILPPGSHSLRPLNRNGTHYAMHWCRGKRDWGGLFENYAAVGSPKIIHAGDGTVHLESFDWGALHEGKSFSLLKDVSPVGGTFFPASGKLECRGYGALLSAGEYEDFEIKSEIRPGQMNNSPLEFGMLLRADATGDTGIYLICAPARQCLEMVRMTHCRPFGEESLVRSRTVLQSVPLPRGMEDGGTFRAIAFGPSIEFNLNGRLLMQYFTMPERGGHAGIFAEDGAVTISGGTLCRLRPPVCNYRQ